MDCSPPGSSVHGDCPGKNTGVGCHGLLRGIFPIQGLDLRLLRLLHWQQALYHQRFLGSPAMCVSHSVVSDSLQPHGLWLAGLLCPWDSPAKNTGVDCHALLQGIFLTQGSNPGLLHCRWILHALSPWGRPLAAVRASSSVGRHVR